MWWMLFACGGSSPEAASDPPPTVTTDESTTTVPSEASDADLVRSLIAGNAAIDDVLPDIAWSDGWPVHDGDTWIFVYPSNAETVDLAGDFDNWEPEAMTSGDGFFWAEVEISNAAGMKYKFVDADNWIADAWARSYTYDEFGRASYVAPDTDVFHLERWPSLMGAGLEPRDVRVYVPPGTGPWPVLYMHDGQNLFDPEGIWGGWRMIDALADVPPLLVVGIDNTPARFDEYTHVPDDIGYGDIYGGDGDAYAELVHEILRPHIESLYATSGKNGQLGSSLGGLIALHIAQLYPSEYDFSGSMSGTLGWGRFALGNPTMQELWLANPPPIAVYVDSGGGSGNNGCEDPNGDGFYVDDPDASDNYCTSLQFAEALANDGFTWEQDLWHWHEPGQPHNEMAWAERVFRPLGIFSDL